MFKGSLVALVTPMRADGAVDGGAFSKFVDWQIGAGHAGPRAGRHHRREPDAEP